MYGRSNLVVTPIQKVLEMLSGMLAQSEEAIKQERVQYSAYKQYCDDATVSKQRDVSNGDGKIETLQAQIEKFDNEVARLGREVQDHQDDIEGWAGEVSAAEVVRNTERTDYEAMHRNYTESVLALRRAVDTLKAQAQDKPATMAMLQHSNLSMEQIPAVARRTIEAFLARGDAEPDLNWTAPSPDAYEFKSHNVIDMLEKLGVKFRDMLTNLEKEEVSRRQAYEMLRQNLQDNIKAARAAIDSKTETQAKNKQSSAESTAALQDTTTTRDDDAETLSDMVSQCQTKLTDFDSRQALRAEEIQALTQVIELISGAKVSGAAEAHLSKSVNLVSKRTTSLAQLRASSPSDTQKKDKLLAVASLLHEASSRLGSHALAAIALRAREDPFAKVKQLIQELIDRLQEQASEEATHKSWCDGELSANEKTRVTKTNEIETLTAQVDKLSADISILKREIAELSEVVAQLAKDIAKETELRTSGKAQNEQTLQEARDAQAAMSEAISILKAFYSKASDATVFSQVARQDNSKQPAIFDTPYKGLQDQKTGVLAMMEVIQSDFARLEQQTDTAEEAASQLYDKFMEDSLGSKNQKGIDIANKQALQQSKEADLLDATSDLDNAHQELDAAMATYDRLKPACLDASVSFESRSARRNEEIESLKEALNILNGESAEVIQGVLVTGAGQHNQLRSDITGLDYR